MLGMQSSTLLPRVLAFLLPHPVGYRLAWSRAGSAAPLHAWRPLPPSDEFVALGLVCTVGSEPPGVEEVRCVPVGWTSGAPPPKRVWEDSGRGGRPGCLWAVDGQPGGGGLMLLGVSAHRQQPPTDVKQLAAKEFWLHTRPWPSSVLVE